MKKLFLIALTLLCLAGCTNEEKPTIVESPSPLATYEQEPDKTIGIVKDDGWYENLNVYEDCEHNFTHSGDSEERVVLVTSAQKDEDGFFMWDDSQHWALYVENDEGIYPLYDSSIHGRLSMNVSEHYLENGEIEDVIRLTISQSAGFEIREYRFSDGVFHESVAYTAGAINELSVNRYY